LDFVAPAVCVAAEVAFFVATGFVVLPAFVEEVEGDEADAEEPVPVVPITVPPAMLIELVVDN
jgi:hypothetical protein